jgi:hypothetical protein
MVHSDDELRERLVRERARRGQRHTAASVLTDLRPAMRRARRRRIATGTAAVTMALGGIVGAAQVIRTDRDTMIRTSSDSTPTEPQTASATTGDVRDPDGSGVTTVPTTLHASGVTVAIDNGIHAGDTQVSDDPTSVPTDTTAASVATGDGGSHDDGAGSSDSSGSQGGGDTNQQTSPPPVVPATPTTVAGKPKPGPTTTVVTTTTVPATTTTTTAGSQTERFDSRCGYVLANRSTSSVEIVEVVPDSSYDYRIEDPDHGDVTVQFFGGSGEDCELKITTTGGGRHH